MYVCIHSDFEYPQFCLIMRIYFLRCPDVNIAQVSEIISESLSISGKPSNPYKLGCLRMSEFHV